MRAAASTCLAFLACHPLGAKGDSCLEGPFRQQLLGVGTFGALLKAALACSPEDVCDAIIQQTAAVGLMYLATSVSLARIASAMFEVMLSTVRMLLLPINKSAGLC